MTEHGSADVFIYVQGLDMSPDTFEMTDEVEGITEEMHPFGGAQEEHLPVGLARTTLEASGGFYDSATGKTLDAYGEKSSTRQIVSYGKEGVAVGAEVVILDGSYAVKFLRIADVAALTKAHAEHTIDAQHMRAQIVHGPTSETAAGDTESTPVDHNDSRHPVPIEITSSSVANPTNILCVGAHGLITGDEVVIAGHTGSTPDINGQEVVTVIDTLNFTVVQNVTVGGTVGTAKKVTSTGCTADLHVLELTLGGYDSFTFTLRDSDDDITYGDVVAFTATTAIGAERKSVLTEVQRYTALVWTLQGAGSDPTVTPYVAVHRPA